MFSKATFVPEFHTINLNTSSNSSLVTLPEWVRSKTSKTNFVFSPREFGSLSFVLDVVGRKCAKIYSMIFLSHMRDNPFLRKIANTGVRFSV